MQKIQELSIQELAFLGFIHSVITYTEYYRYIMIDLPSNPVVTVSRCSGQSCARRWTILREAKRKKRCLKRAEEVDRLLEPLVVGGDRDAPAAPGPANSTAV